MIGSASLGGLAFDWPKNESKIKATFAAIASTAISTVFNLIGFTVNGSITYS